VTRRRSSLMQRCILASWKGTTLISSHSGRTQPRRLSLLPAAGPIFLSVKPSLSSCAPNSPKTTDHVFGNIAYRAYSCLVERLAEEVLSLLVDAARPKVRADAQLRVSKPACAKYHSADMSRVASYFRAQDSLESVGTEDNLS
jgi:hypothetical protein